VVKKAFSEAGARQAIAAFRDTINIANLNGDGYTSSGSDKMPTSEASMSSVKTVAQNQPSATIPQPTQQNPGRQDVFSLAEGPVIIQWPAYLSAESFQDLGDWLDIVKRKIGRSVKMESEG
jgi:hypothetical protein